MALIGFLRFVITILLRRLGLSTDRYEQHSLWMIMHLAVVEFWLRTKKSKSFLKLLHCSNYIYKSKHLLADSWKLIPRTLKSDSADVIRDIRPSGNTVLCYFAKRLDTDGSGGEDSDRNTPDREEGAVSGSKTTTESIDDMKETTECSKESASETVDSPQQFGTPLKRKGGPDDKVLKRRRSSAGLQGTAPKPEDPASESKVGGQILPRPVCRVEMSEFSLNLLEERVVPPNVYEAAEPTSSATNNVRLSEVSNANVSTDTNQDTLQKNSSSIPEWNIIEHKSGEVKTPVKWFPPPIVQVPKLVKTKSHFLKHPSLTYSKNECNDVPAEQKQSSVGKMVKMDEDGESPSSVIGTPEQEENKDINSSVSDQSTFHEEDRNSQCVLASNKENPSSGGFQTPKEKCPPITAHNRKLMRRKNNLFCRSLSEPPSDPRVNIVQPIPPAQLIGRQLRDFDEKARINEERNPSVEADDIDEAMQRALFESCKESAANLREPKVCIESSPVYNKSARPPEAMKGFETDCNKNNVEEPVPTTSGDVPSEGKQGEMCETSYWSEDCASYPGIAEEPLKVKKDARYQKRFYKKKPVLLTRKLGRAIQEGASAESHPNALKEYASKHLSEEELQKKIEHKTAVREYVQQFMHEFWDVNSSSDDSDDLPSPIRRKGIQRTLSKDDDGLPSVQSTSRSTLYAGVKGYKKIPYFKKSPSSSASDIELQIPKFDLSFPEIYPPLNYGRPCAQDTSIVPKLSTSPDVIVISSAETSPLRPSCMRVGATRHLTMDSKRWECVCVKFNSDLFCDKEAIFCRNHHFTPSPPDIPVQSMPLIPLLTIVARIEGSRETTVEEFLCSLWNLQKVYTEMKSNCSILYTLEDFVELCNTIPIRRSSMPDGDYELVGDTLVRTSTVDVDTETNQSQLPILVNVWQMDSEQIPSDAGFVKEKMPSLEYENISSSEDSEFQRSDSENTYENSGKSDKTFQKLAHQGQVSNPDSRHFKNVRKVCAEIFVPEMEYASETPENLQTNSARRQGEAIQFKIEKIETASQISPPEDRPGTAEDVEISYTETRNEMPKATENVSCTDSLYPSKRDQNVTKCDIPRAEMEYASETPENLQTNSSRRQGEAIQFKIEKIETASQILPPEDRPGTAEDVEISYTETRNEMPKATENVSCTDSLYPSKRDQNVMNCDIPRAEIKAEAKHLERISGSETEMEEKYGSEKPSTTGSDRSSKNLSSSSYVPLCLQEKLEVSQLSHGHGSEFISEECESNAPSSTNQVTRVSELLPSSHSGDILGDSSFRGDIRIEGTGETELSHMSDPGRISEKPSSNSP